MEGKLDRTQHHEDEVRRASGVVNTATRVAIAREKARTLRPKVRPPSALEEEAVLWEREQEARANRAAKERQEISRQEEAPPFSMQSVSLRASGSEIKIDEELGWKAYIPTEAADMPRSPRVIGHIPIMSMARQVIQRERAGGKTVVTDPQTRALEEAGRRWEEERARQSTGAER